MGGRSPYAYLTAQTPLLLQQTVRECQSPAKVEWQPTYQGAPAPMNAVSNDKQKGCLTQRTAGSLTNTKPGRGRADGVSPHSNTRPSQSFLLNHRHAVLANMHLHEYLFSSPEEGFLGGLMHLYHFENDTTCDGQGPTYANWTRQEKHAATYHSVSSDLLISMRLSSASADVICDWRVALAQGADLAHFHSVATQVWLTVAPEFKPMHSSCPLFARKLAPEALSSYMAALWHA